MAELALENEIWAQAVFHSQQATEKALKTVLYLNKVVVFKHSVLKEISRLKDFKLYIKAAQVDRSENESKVR